MRIIPITWIPEIIDKIIINVIINSINLIGNPIEIEKLLSKDINKSWLKNTVIVNITSTLIKLKIIKSSIIIG